MVSKCAIIRECILSCPLILSYLMEYIYFIAKKKNVDYEYHVFYEKIFNGALTLTWLLLLGYYFAQVKNVLFFYSKISDLFWLKNIYSQKEGNPFL